MIHLGRYRKFAAAILALIVLVALMSLTARERETMMVIERAILGLAAPIENWLGGLAAGIRGGVADIQAISRLRQENESLKAKADAYDATTHRLMELEQENERLRGLLGFRQAVTYETVAADVVARNPDNWWSRVTINRGAADGVARNMPVMTSQGLVGRVVEVSAHLAVVELLTDRDCQVGALVQSSRDAGVVRGQGSQADYLSVMLFARNAVVNVDDAIVTSGLGEIYPAGLYIGRVTKVTKDKYGLLKYATVEPAVEFGRLEEVLVITTPREAVTPQDDAAAAGGAVGGASGGVVGGATGGRAGSAAGGTSPTAGGEGQ